MRLTLNIKKYEEAGLNYEMFAGATLLVFLFAGVRTVYIATRSDWRTIWTFAIIPAMVAQLAVLCVHVVTSSRASITVVAAFISTVFCTALQTFAIIRDMRSDLSKHNSKDK